MKVSVPMYATGPLAHALADHGVKSVDMTLNEELSKWELEFLTPLPNRKALAAAIEKIGGTILGGDDAR